jgi:hypothetical protein
VSRFADFITDCFGGGVYFYADIFGLKIFSDFVTKIYMSFADTDDFDLDRGEPDWEIARVVLY